MIMSKWMQLSGNLYKENDDNSIIITSEQGKRFLNVKVEINVVDEKSGDNEMTKRKHQDNYREIQTGANIIGEIAFGNVEIHKEDVENEGGVTLYVTLKADPKAPHGSSSPSST